MTKGQKWTPEDEAEYRFKRTVAGGARTRAQTSLPALCDTTACAICGRVWISAVRLFPKPYACPGCNPEWEEKRRVQHETWMAKHKRCPLGHELNEENVYHTPTGGHRCRACMAMYRQKMNARRAEKKLARRHGRLDELARQPPGA